MNSRASIAVATTVISSVIAGMFALAGTIILKRKRAAAHAAAAEAEYEAEAAALSVKIPGSAPDTKILEAPHV